jgi:RNA polymerase sigma-70 factor (ECF subfamily)
MNVQTVSDQELIREFLSGNEQALDTLIRRHKRNIYSVIYLMVRNRDLADDLFQETFIKIIHTLRKGSYNEEGKFLPWAARVARNLCIDHMRKSQRDLTITDTAGNDVLSFLSVADEDQKNPYEQHRQEVGLKQVIMQLPQEQRDVLIMRHWGNLSFKEIADLTGVSINTALGRMRYALTNLKKLLENQQIDMSELRA